MANANANAVSLEDLLKQDQELEAKKSELATKIREAREANATKNYDQVVDLLKSNFEFFNVFQRQTIKGIVGAEGGNGGKGGKGGKGQRIRGNTVPVYQLDTGEICGAQGKFKGQDKAAFEAAIKKAGGKRENLPRYPNPNYKGNKPVNTPQTIDTSKATGGKPEPTPPAKTPEPTPAAKK